MVRTIGVEITGEQDVKRLQKELNELASSASKLESVIGGLKGGAKALSFNVDVNLDTSQAEKKAKALGGTFKKALGGNGNQSTQWIDNQIRDIASELGGAAQKIQQKIAKKYVDLGMKVADDFEKGLKFHGSIGDEAMNKLWSDLQSAAQLLQAKHLKIPIKADVDYTFATTKDGYVDISSKAFEQAKAQMSELTKYSANNKSLQRFINQFSLADTSIKQHAKSIVSSFMAIVNTGVFDKLYSDLKKLTTISFQTTFKPAQVIFKTLASSIKSQMASAASYTRSVFLNAFNKIKGAGSKLFQGLVEESKALGDAVTAYGNQMKALGMSEADIQNNEKDIVSYGKNTAYNAKDLLSYGGQYTALGIEDPNSLVKAVAGLAGGTKNPTQAYDGISKQLVDAIQKGQLNWQDVRIIQTWQSALATNKLNKYLKENDLLGGYSSLKEAVANNALSVADYVKALKAVGLSDELQSLTNQVNTPSQAFDQLKETIALATIGIDGADGAFKGLYKTITDLIKATTDWINNNQSAIDSLGALTDRTIESIKKWGQETASVYATPLKQNLKATKDQIVQGYDGFQVANSATGVVASVDKLVANAPGEEIGKSISNTLALFGDIASSFIALADTFLTSGGLNAVQGTLALLSNVTNDIAHSNTFPTLIGIYNDIYTLLNTLASNKTVVDAVDSVLNTLGNAVRDIIKIAQETAESEEFNSFITFLKEQLNTLITDLSGVFKELITSGGEALNSKVGRKAIKSIREFISELAQFVLKAVQSFSTSGDTTKGFENILDLLTKLLDFLTGVLNILNAHPMLMQGVIWTAIGGAALTKVAKAIEGVSGVISPTINMFKGISKLSKAIFNSDMMLSARIRLLYLGDFFKNLWSNVGSWLKGPKAGASIATEAAEGIATETAGNVAGNVAGSTTGTVLGKAKSLGSKAWGGLKSSKGALLKGGAATLALNGANMVVQKSGANEFTKSGLNSLTSVANGAMLGATVGSMIPVIGTGIGAVVGAVGAGAYEVFKGLKTIKSYSVPEAQAKIKELQEAINTASNLPLQAYVDSQKQIEELMNNDSLSLQEAVTETLNQRGITSQEFIDSVVSKMQENGGKFDLAMQQTCQELQLNVNKLQDQTAQSLKEGKDSVKIGDDFWVAVSDGWDAVVEFGNGIGNAILGIVNSVASFFSDMSDKLESFDRSVNNWIDGVADNVSSFFTGKKSTKKSSKKGKKSKKKHTGGVIYRSEGGPVPGIDWVSQGTDTVPAMLTPGEYVVRKQAVDSVGRAFMNRLNNIGSQALTNISGGNRTVINNYYNTNNAKVTQNVNNQSQYLNGMNGLDRMMRYV